MRENRLSGSMRGGARRSLAFGLSIRRLRLLYMGQVYLWAWPASWSWADLLQPVTASAAAPSASNRTDKILISGIRYGNKRIGLFRDGKSTRNERRNCFRPARGRGRESS